MPGTQLAAGQTSIFSPGEMALWMVFGFFVIFLGLWLIFGLISVSARSFRTWWHTRDPLPPPRPTYAFPVIARPVESIHGEADGPGLYRVAGVVRTTGADIELHVEAQTLANARVKAELKGIIVTAIERERVGGAD